MVCLCVSISLAASSALLSIVLYLRERYSAKWFSRSSSDADATPRHDRLPPGPAPWPIIGNLPRLQFSGRAEHDVINGWVKDYGGVVTFTVFGTRFVIVSDVDVIRETFQSADINDMAPIPACNKALGVPLDQGIGIISASEGSDWRDIRKFLITSLRRMKFGCFEQFAADEAVRLTSFFELMESQPFDPKHVVNVAVANVMTRLVFGTTYKYDDAKFLRLTELADYVFDYFGTGAITSLVPEFSYLPSSANQRGETAIEEMFLFIKESVEQHRLTFDPEADPKDLVEFFLQEQHQRSLEGDVGVFSETNLVQFTWDILIGGWQTINTTILWYLLLLAQHPDDQRRLQLDIDRIIGRDRLPKLSDRPSLPLVEATMAECYRLSRLLPIQIPHRARRDVTVGGYRVPKGSYVATNTHYLCSSPALWENPDDFLPTRFIDTEGQFNRRLEKDLVEFGVGRRACPGEQLSRTELFVFFTYIFHQFTIELPPNAPHTMKGKSGLTFNPLPFQIRAVKRH